MSRCHLASLALLIASVAVADDPKVKAPAPALAPAEKALFDTVRASRKALQAADAYSVSVETTWKHTGGKTELSGVATAKLLFDKAGRVRIEVGDRTDPKPHYVVVCDGKQVFRHFVNADLYSLTPCDGTPLDDLQTDGVTLTALRTAAAEMLARPDPVAVLAAQMLGVEDLGGKGEKGDATHGFRVSLASGRVVSIRFRDDKLPLPVSLNTTYEIRAGEKKSYAQTLDARFTYDLAVKPAADAFAIPTPDKAVRKVDDLMEAIFAGDRTDMIGKPAPAVEFTGLDGKAVALDSFKGKSVVVLYAWATWAAPSTESMPGLNAFAAEYAKKGVTFLAVNVGEKADAVKAFVAKAKYTGTVLLDPTGAGLAAVRGDRVPMVVIVDKGGTIRAYHRGKDGTAEKVKEELDKLLK